MTPSLFQRTMLAAIPVVLCEVSRVQQGLVISVFKDRAAVLSCEWSSQSLKCEEQ